MEKTGDSSERPPNYSRLSGISEEVKTAMGEFEKALDVNLGPEGRMGPDM